MTDAMAVAEETEGFETVESEGSGPTKLSLQQHCTPLESGVERGTEAAKNFACVVGFVESTLQKRQTTEELVKRGG